MAYPSVSPESRGAKLLFRQALLEYRRGTLTEWYRDAALGMEQGFTIHKAPRGAGLITLQSGDTALVGADGDDVGANSDQGSAYVFARSGTTWSLQQKLTAADGAAEDSFGRSVALSGDTALVGAVHDDVGANTEQGSAYFYDITVLTYLFCLPVVSKRMP